MSASDNPQMHRTDDGDRDRLLQSIRRRVQALTVAVVLLALALFLEVAAVFGYVVDFHGGEYLMVAATAVGTAVLGFFFGLAAGWLIRRQ